ncbi:MAG: hypothetical protein C0497_02990 [Gemmatimonas sp.]|nr:hypothetical protein [Gemmatimonas sp.]
MICSPKDAIDRLGDLASLFEHARQHAQSDSVALSEMLDQAQRMLEDIAPAAAAARNTPHEAAVLQAALRAKDSHSALVGEIGFGVAKLAGELRQLTAGAQATDRYLPAATGVQVRPMNRVG